MSKACLRAGQLAEVRRIRACGSLSGWPLFLAACSPDDAVGPRAALLPSSKLKSMLWATMETMVCDVVELRKTGAFDLASTQVPLLAFYALVQSWTVPPNPCISHAWPSMKRSQPLCLEGCLVHNSSQVTSHKWQQCHNDHSSVFPATHQRTA
jgi:hypothetical protein